MGNNEEKIRCIKLGGARMDSSIFFPAILTSVFCYLGAIESSCLFGMTGGFYIVGRPLVAGFLTGLAFGDIRAGILCGLAVQGVFIANLSTGGATNSEITYASYGGIGLALATTKDPAIAVTLAILIGQTFGLIFYNFRMAAYSFWNERASRAAENNDTHAIFLNHVLFPQITTFLIRAVPVFFAIYLGQGLVDSLLSNVPDIVTHIISVLGGVLPALGIAMLMGIVIKEAPHFIFYMIGFVLLAFTNIGMIALVFIAVLIAYLTYISGGRDKVAVVSNNDNPETVKDVYEDDDLF